jgi:hypothetical protein
MIYKSARNQEHMEKEQIDILYDGRHINNVYSGLGRYTASLLEGLLQAIGTQRSISVLFDSNEDYSNNFHYQKLKPLMDEVGVVEHCVDAPLYSIHHHVKLSVYINRLKPNLYFYPHFDLPIFIKCPKIFVIHDLKTIVLKRQIQSWAFLKKQYFSKIIQLNLRKTNTQCIAISKYTRDDIFRQIGGIHKNKIKVVYEDSFLKNTRSMSPLGGVKTPFLFYIGDRRPHKNLKKMIDIFVKLKQNHNYDGYFYIAGNDRNFGFDVESYVKTFPFVILLPNLTDAQLRFMYQEMQSLFYLSRYEGFGLPVVEAANFNKKIISSDNTSLKEVAPKYSLQLDSEINLEEGACAISDYLSNKLKINNTVYLSQFSWKKSAEEIFFA